MCAHICSTSGSSDLARYETMRGAWRPSQPVQQDDFHTRVEMTDGAGSSFISHGLGAFVRSVDFAGRANSFLTLNVSRPGMHSLWYAIDPIGCVYWDEHRWSLMRQLRVDGVNAKTSRVEAGHLVITNGVQTRDVTIQPEHLPTARPGLTLDAAIAEFWSIFLEATREMYEIAGRPRVTALLSAGTDSTLGTIALREIGADVHAVCVGRTEDDFDARYARNYAAQLGVPYTFLPLPADTPALNQLAYDAVAASEYSEMSNTLMAMCTTLVRRWAIEQKRPCLWKGHYADDLLGTSNATYGTFKKKFPAQTDQEWSEYRASLYQHIIPNDMQVAQVCRRDGAIWRSTFTHPKVAEFVWSMPKAVVPLRLIKPLFAGACELFLDPTTCSWNVDEKKVGYYTGSGIGKIRLENPVLGDDNFRRLYKLAKERLT